MKKWLLLLFLIFTSTGYGAYMQARGLQNTGEYWSNFATTGFGVECESFYGFTRHTIECSYALKEDYWDNDKPSNQPFEITWVLDLPSDAIVTQAWFKTGNEWIQAQPENVLDAEEMYDDTGYTQPRFLFRELVSVNYNGIKYKTHQINMGPVYYPNSYSIKFTYITQNKIDINSLRKVIEVNNYLYNYRQSDITFTIKFLDHEFPDNKPIDLNSHYSFSKVGDWWQASERFRDRSSDRYHSDASLKWDRPFTAVPEFRTFTVSEKQYYHYMMLPPVTPQDRDVKRILLLYDLGTEIAYNFNRSYILDRYQQMAKLTLAPTDSINMIFMGSFMPQTLYESFIPATPGNIDNMFNALKNMTSVQISGLPQLLRAAKDVFNASGAGGELWLLSNAQKHCNPPSVANEIMNLSYYQLEFPVIHNIFDCRSYNDYYTAITINGQTYYGNDYLYQNLARLSGGGLLTAFQLDYYDLDLEIAEVFAPAADLVKVDVLPNSGYTFTKYDLNNGKTHYPITFPVQELGRYEGTPPLETVFYGQVNGETLRKTQTVTNTIEDTTNKYLGPIWNSKYLTDLLQQPQSFATIEKIAELSKEYELLSPYCGFVVPAPSGYRGFKRLAEVDTTYKDTEGGSDEPGVIPQDYSLGAFPNPFNSNITIQFDLPPANMDRTIEIRIYDVIGRLVREFRHDFPASEYRLNIRWDGTNEHGNPVSTGLYLVQCTVGDVHETVKITYLK